MTPSGLKRIACSHALILLVALLLIPQRGTGQFASPKREFRGTWIASVFNLDWPNRNHSSATQQQTLISLLDELKDSGHNAVILQVRPECDALYASAYEPWSYWLTGQQGAAPSPFYDPLAFAVEQAHARGMELHAWINPYRVNTLSTYTRSPDHVINAHPFWLLRVDSNRILDPGLPEVRDHIANVVVDIVRRYDVDGIHADDYFYLENITTQDDGTFIAYSRGFTDRNDWRRDNVNLLIRQLYDSLQAIRPHVKLGMSPFGIWKPGVPAGIPTWTFNPYDDIYGDPLAWLQGGYIDYLAPQIYWNIGTSDNIDYDLLLNWWAGHMNGRHLYVGHANYKIASPSWSAQELPDQIRRNRQLQWQDVYGNIFYRATYGVTDNPRGILDSLRNTLYRSVALIPPMPWKDATPPLHVRNLRSDPAVPDRILWDPPTAASDGDSASRYVVYHYTLDPGPTPSLDNPANILAVVPSTEYSIPASLARSGTIFVAVTALDRNHNESIPSGMLRIAMPVAGAPTAVTGPDAYGLQQNYPNPFNTSTQLQFSLPEAGMVSLRVYNMLGQEVAVVLEQVMTEGTHVVHMNASNLSTGTYLAVMNSAGGRFTRRMILLK